MAEDISFVVLSYDVGSEKPKRPIFDAATDILKASVASLGPIDEWKKLYVGDSVKNDYMGAKKAGWHAVLIDRESSEVDRSKRETGAERKAPIETRRVEVGDGQWKKIRVVRGLDELVNWHPKNKWTGERAGRNKAKPEGGPSTSGEES